MTLERVIISAPFGNYLTFPGVTSTLGSFTRAKRGGVPRRIWRMLTTVRYYRRPQSWINRLGLPNPGIDAIRARRLPVEGKIISLYGFNKADWNALIFAACHYSHLELNLSCPNVEHTQVVEDVLATVSLFPRDVFIAKLPPLDWFALANPLYDAGIRTFHLCNTIQTPGGGLSGKVLKQYSLWAIREFRQKWGTKVRLIGGGGITSCLDIADYFKAGADHIALGSTLLNPFNHDKIPLFAAVAWDYQHASPTVHL